ncbi:MAG TPA: flagellar hook-associated protein FlgL [Bacillales bacterium]|nr:flagellar hook-associated protein FlgL [Bacillales bacterium]
MRVTQSMLTTNFLRNLSDSYQRLAKYQNQLATGKKITRPSDDPVVATLGMEYRTNLSHVEQYQRNLSTAYKWMNSSEDALKEATSVMQRVYELTVQASNGTYDVSQRDDIATEIGQLKKQMASIANTRVAGKYIFNGTDTKGTTITVAGTETKVKPVDLSGGIRVSGNSDDVTIEVNDGIEIRVNVDPTQVFTEDLFQGLTDLQNDLKNGASPEAIGSYLSGIKDKLDNIVSERAELGARYDRVEMVEKRLGSQKVIASQILSDNEDVDLEKVIMNLKIQESVHRAALAAGARIMQPTLMDFLR